MAFCRQCGAAVAETAIRCPSCGAQQESGSPATMRAAAGNANITQPFDYYTDAFYRYAEFSGRATRSAFWYFVLFDCLIGLGFSILDGAFHPTFFDHVDMTLDSLYGLATVLPFLAVMVRRLHDTSRSGWNMLWVLLPFAGWIVLLVFLVQETRPEQNVYGPPPVPA